MDRLQDGPRGLPGLNQKGDDGPIIDVTPYDTAIAEIHLSGAVSLGRCSPSTVYRWARTINGKLLFEHAEWSVKPNIADRSLEYCPEPPKTPAPRARKGRHDHAPR